MVLRGDYGESQQSTYIYNKQIKFYEFFFLDFISDLSHTVHMGMSFYIYILDYPCCVFTADSGPQFTSFMHAFMCRIAAVCDNRGTYMDWM